MIWSWRNLGAIVTGLVLGLSLSSCSTVFPKPETTLAGGGESAVRQNVANPTPETGSGGSGERVEVWLVSGSYHTGLVLPCDWLVEGGLVLPQAVAGSKWVNMSWGDRVAYEQERWLRPSEILLAFLTPTESVLEMIRVDYEPRWVFPDQQVFRGTVERSKGRELAAFIEHNCRPVSAAAEWAVIGGSTWGEGCLIKSPHTYGFPRLCNSWTAGALEICGYSFDPVSRLLASALIRDCRRQGFEPVPALSDAEREFLAKYLRQAGYVGE